MHRMKTIADQINNKYQEKIEECRKHFQQKLDHSESRLAAAQEEAEEKEKALNEVKAELLEAKKQAEVGFGALFSVVIITRLFSVFQASSSVQSRELAAAEHTARLEAEMEAMKNDYKLQVRTFYFIFVIKMLLSAQWLAEWLLLSNRSNGSAIFCANELMILAS